MKVWLVRISTTTAIFWINALRIVGTAERRPGMVLARGGLCRLVRGVKAKNICNEVWGRMLLLVGPSIDVRMPCSQCCLHSHVELGLCFERLTALNKCRRYRDAVSQLRRNERVGAAVLVTGREQLRAILTMGQSTRSGDEWKSFRTLVIGEIHFPETNTV